MKYLVIDLLEIVKKLNKFNICLSFNCDIRNRVNVNEDVFALFGQCQFIRNRQKFIIKCKNAILYDYDSTKEELKISKLKDYNETIFWMPNRKYEDEIKNAEFEMICDLLEKYCIQETTKEGYERCLGPEIGEEITKLINKI